MPAVFVYFVYTNYILSKYSWLISLGLDFTESVIHVFSHVDGSAHYWLRDSLQNSIAVEQKVQRLNHFLNETKCFQYYLSQSKLSNQSGQNWTFPPQHSLNQLIFLCSNFSVFNKALYREYERFELQALEVCLGPKCGWGDTSTGTSYMKFWSLKSTFKLCFKNCNQINFISSCTTESTTSKPTS